MSLKCHSVLAFTSVTLLCCLRLNCMIISLRLCRKIGRKLSIAWHAVHGMFLSLPPFFRIDHWRSHTTLTSRTHILCHSLPPVHSQLNLLQTPLQAAFLATPDLPWAGENATVRVVRRPGGAEAGAGQLTYVTVEDSGHMVSVYSLLMV